MAAEALEGAGGALGAEALEGAAEYCRTVLHAKRRIHECLTVLGIMHQRRDQEVAAPGAQRADEMHCAMVMLNSGLLKALHVTDSFHAHCHRECPELGALLDGGDPPAAEEAAAAHGDPDEGLASERYRQLQAECVCRAELLRSLDARHRDDETRAKRLEDECRGLRARLGQAAYAGGGLPPASRPGTSCGVAVQRCAEGGVVVLEPELGRLAASSKKLEEGWAEAREQVEQLRASSEAARRGAESAAEERRELRELLGAGEEGLQDAVAQLLQDLASHGAERAHGGAPAPGAAAVAPAGSGPDGGQRPGACGACGAAGAEPMAAAQASATAVAELRRALAAAAAAPAPAACRRLAGPRSAAPPTVRRFASVPSLAEAGSPGGGRGPRAVAAGGPAAGLQRSRSGVQRSLSSSQPRLKPFVVAALR